jgi:hypothetical protein
MLAIMAVAVSCPAVSADCSTDFDTIIAAAVERILDRTCTIANMIARNSKRNDYVLRSLFKSSGLPSPSLLRPYGMVSTIVGTSRGGNMPFFYVNTTSNSFTARILLPSTTPSSPPKSNRIAFPTWPAFRIYVQQCFSSSPWRPRLSRPCSCRCSFAMRLAPSMCALPACGQSAARLRRAFRIRSSKVSAITNLLMQTGRVCPLL